MLGVNEKRYQRGYDSRAGQLMRQPRNFTTIVTDQSNKSTRPCTDSTSTQLFFATSSSARILDDKRTTLLHLLA